MVFLRYLREEQELVLFPLAASGVFLVVAACIYAAWIESSKGLFIFFPLAATVLVGSLVRVWVQYSTISGFAKEVYKQTLLRPEGYTCSSKEFDHHCWRLSWVTLDYIGGRVVVWMGRELLDLNPAEQKLLITPFKDQWQRDEESHKKRNLQLQKQAESYLRGEGVYAQEVSPPSEEEEVLNLMVERQAERELRERLSPTPSYGKTLK